MISDWFHRTKVFGVGIDASDDPWTMQLKLAAIYARENGALDLCLDPYDAIALDLMRCNKNVESIGKFPVPSWLTPIPRLSDVPLVKKENMERFSLTCLLCLESIILRREALSRPFLRNWVVGT
jgi:hypothetical protein